MTFESYRYTYKYRRVQITCTVYRITDFELNTNNDISNNDYKVQQQLNFLYNVIRLIKTNRKYILFFILEKKSNKINWKDLVPILS